MKVVLAEAGTICGVDTRRDLDTITVRFKHEGDPFLGITLAEFGKAFERALELGFVDNATFQGFRSVRGLPAFLQGFLCQVFDRESGVLLVEPDVNSIQAIRQITLMWAKMEEDCVPVRKAKAVRSYHECESDVRQWTKMYRYDTSMRDDFRRVSRLLFGDLFSDLDRDAQEGRLDPAHGPGQTANKRQGNRKWLLTDWTLRLEKVFPMVDNLLPNPRYWKHLGVVNVREPGAEDPVRVQFVPKTMKTPRVIAMEPHWQMYCQKGIQRKWYEYVDSGHVFSSSFHGFGLLDDRNNEHQAINRYLARVSSADKSLATLDLSEASDRVSIALVADLLRGFPSLREAVFATRSTRAQTPDGRTSVLWKFASMGSALCFPVEAAVFLTVIFIGIEREFRTQLNRKTLREFIGSVRVYGDDIIVPVNFATAVEQALEAFGFKVNQSKSFRYSNFRESCGGDYFNGYDVSVVRLRSKIPINRKDGSETISMVSFRNQMYIAGWWKTAAYCDGLLTKLLGHYPAVADTSPVLGRLSHLGYDTEWFNKQTHSPRVKGWVARAPLPANAVDGVPALNKVFRNPGIGCQDPKHLIHSGRPKSVGLTLRGVSPF
jgi:hypothetical protein